MSSTTSTWPSATLCPVRDAANRRLNTLLATDRAAIFTTSGQVMLDFTDDKDELHAAIGRLRPTPLTRAPVQRCPDVSYHLADLIQNHNDTTALMPMQETMVCMSLDQNQRTMAEDLTRRRNSRVMSEGQHETRVTLSVLRDVIRRMAATPGQRNIVLVSPGFLTPEEQQDKTELLDRAIRANVVISALDARGLYTDLPDISKRAIDFNSERVKQQYDREASRAQADVLAEMAYGTGGVFFQNNNDMDAGFERTARTPEYFYVLGFSPQNLKLDGTFHALKVTLKTRRGSATRRAAATMRPST